MSPVSRWWDGRMPVPYSLLNATEGLAKFDLHLSHLFQKEVNRQGNAGLRSIAG